ncbi:ClpX C4-type zinc finger protein [Sorangium sp. So ce1000]|uniref:ClpX C4-type zinc finger protein n=1 Tax=Sorangium sp. So ce1000 TaxID=3133325 RepID=UPI003F625C3C
MTLDEEITAVENLVQFARGAAADHLERATKVLNLRSKELARYETFLDSTILNATSTLTLCRETASAPAVFPDASTSIAQGLLASVRESIRLMYVAMTVIEGRAGSGGFRDPHQGESAHTTGSGEHRACSFCGKSDAASKLVAGPAANICASCTRLACGVLGIGLSEIKTE